MKTRLAFAVLFLGLASIFVSSVKAQDSSVSAEPTETPKAATGTFNFRETSETPKPSETPEPKETPRVKGLDKLEGVRLNFCQKHEDEVNTRLSSLGDLVANILGKFDAIATRVEQFYKNTVLPSGKTVTNYDALVADISAKRALAVTALKNTQNDITGFSCTANNPKGQIKLFRTDMQSVKQALQNYRTSIKNLIEAVRSVAGEGQSPEPSSSPEASQSANTR